MGRSGTTSLWSSGLTCCRRALWGALRPIGRVDAWWGEPRKRNQLGLTDESIWNLIACRYSDLKNCTTLALKQSLIADQSYRVKPHEQLVLVSLTHYCASTPSLSTSWSRTTLQGAQGPGKTHLETSFPLRCFQRLSLPHIATRRCHWRDNRYTRGASTPVLSY